MSNCERITHQKWGTVSESFARNERISESLVFLSESLNRSFSRKKRAICWKNWWANSYPCEPQVTCFSLKPKIDPPYCTKVYATVLILCTINPRVLEVPVPSHREIILIIVKTMIYKFHSLILFTGNVAKRKSKFKIFLFCKILKTTPLSNLSSEKCRNTK